MSSLLFSTGLLKPPLIAGRRPLGPDFLTAGGEPLRGLGRENFIVFDAGEKREIVAFEVVDLAELARPSAEPAPLPTPSPQ